MTTSDSRTTKLSQVNTLAGTQTLERGLALIESVIDNPCTIDQLAGSAGLHVSATRRLVAGLINQGFLSLGTDRRLRGGAKLIQLGVRAQSHLDLVGVARGFLNSLSEDTGIPSFLGERSGDYSIHLYRSEGRQRVVVNTPVGTRRRLPETSLGKALLIDADAEWDRIFGEADPRFVGTAWRGEMQEARRRGFVVHISPPPDNLHALAAPLRDASDRVIAAISVVTPRQYVDDTMLAGTARKLLATAAAISAALGHAPKR